MSFEWYSGPFHQRTVVLIQAVQPNLLSFRKSVQKAAKRYPFSARRHRMQCFVDGLFNFLHCGIRIVQNSLIIKSSADGQPVAELLFYFQRMILNLYRVQGVYSQIDQFRNQVMDFSAGMVLINHSQSLHRVHHLFQMRANHTFPLVYRHKQVCIIGIIVMELNHIRFIIFCDPLDQPNFVICHRAHKI